MDKLFIGGQDYVTESLPTELTPDRVLLGAKIIRHTCWGIRHRFLTYFKRDVVLYAYISVDP